MTPAILGLAAILFFYTLFFLVGLWGGRKDTDRSLESLLLANRQLPVFLGILTMIATWVGGGYLNGTAEAVYDPSRGLVWAQAPWGYALSLILGGLFFARKIHGEGHRTFIEVFEIRYGRKVAAVLALPALLGETFWSSAILVALGTTFSTILDLDPSLCILLSAAVAMAYTVIGGLRSVAFTDSIQLLLIAGGLVITLPFIFDPIGGLWSSFDTYLMKFGANAGVTPPAHAWSGAEPWGWTWLDFGLLLALGGIPWQVYFQRVLACPSPDRAVRLSVLAGVGCALIAIPSILIGMAGATLDWSSFGFDAPPMPAMVLPAVIRAVAPPLVAYLALAAIAAAVMSSVDSSILSAASLLVWNLYRPCVGPRSDRHLRIVLRLAVVLFGSLAALLALQIQSVYDLWFLCSDLVYVILFPQLLLALYGKKGDSRAVLAGVAVGFSIRLSGGEALFALPSLFEIYLGETAAYFPFRTIAMLSNLLVTWSTSLALRKETDEGSN